MWASTIPRETFQVAAADLQAEQEVPGPPAAELHAFADPPEDMFDFGCQEQLMRVDVLDEWIKSEFPSQMGAAQGLRNKALKARQARLGRLVVQDRGDVLPSQQFTMRLTCFELHPGICLARDAAVYQAGSASNANSHSHP